MKRRKPLRPRTPLQRKKALRAVKPLKRKTALKAGKPLKRGKWNRNEWEQFDRAMRRAHARWRARVLTTRCIVCVRDGRPRDRSGIRDPHHVLPARYIRRYVRSLRLPADEAAGLLRKLMYDPANGLCVCRDCHDEHERAWNPIPRDAIPEGAFVFATRLGLDYVLDRIYAC